MNTLPTDEGIITLHKKYAPSEAAFELIFTHCHIVWEIAQQLIEKSNLSVNSDLVKVGCFLHDIGVYRLYLPNGDIDEKNYITHGLRGYDLLKGEGFNEQICRFASCHTGVGISKQDILTANLPLPLTDYFAQTLEEQLVMYADKFHTKSTPPKFMTAEAYELFIAKYGKAKVEQFQNFQKLLGIPNLESLAKKYNAAIA